MTSLLEQARAEALDELMRGMLRGAGDALERHGNDPEARAILLSAVAGMAFKIERSLLPGFARDLRTLLDEETAP